MSKTSHKVPRLNLDAAIAPKPKKTFSPKDNEGRKSLPILSPLGLRFGKNNRGNPEARDKIPGGINLSEY